MTDDRKELLQGNVAAAKGAYLAGCRFFAGYPISPSNEIMAHMSSLLKETGTCIQMEDEIASVCAAIGASWSGAKAMTATSGPGLSLMQEGIGYAYFTETPLVIIDVQRAGPATGQATNLGQGDVMQMRYGSHGDVYPIALAPWSVQELYDLTIRAFNLAERYRVPVYVATDAAVATMRETVTLNNSPDLIERKRIAPGSPFGSNHKDGVPPMPAFGDGAKLLVTGSTHDDHGFRRVEDPDVHHALINRLKNKTMHHVEALSDVEAHLIDDASIAFFAYGISARSALAATHKLRDEGVRAGLMRTRTLWPFPKHATRELAKRVSSIIVPECNTGMVAEMVQGVANQAEVIPFSQANGLPIDPAHLVSFAKEHM